MTFYDWILKYKGHNTPRGDLADDISRDKCFPHDGDYDKIIGYFEGRHVGSEVLKTFKSAWKSYTAADQDLR